LTDARRRFPDEPIAAGSRIACRIEYDGSRYSGWQIQSHSNAETVQGDLERGLSAVAAAPVRVHCAGRTDAGVHGFSQVVHFDAPATRSEKSWVVGTNTNLPPAVRVHWAVVVPGTFHARFSALSRRYRYVIADTPVQPAQLVGKVTWSRRPLAETTMDRAAQHLLGERDFSAFRAASCQSSTPMRDVQEVSVVRRGSLVVIDIRANAFLHHMVRNIAGSLMAVGKGTRGEDWIAGLLAGADRTRAADTAPPDGLYLVEVQYPTEYDLPDTPDGPLLLGGGSLP
jgi:tRNA pseudouridine38-40 synthase